MTQRPASVFIDCITHALTGPAILRAVGINKDGSVSNPDPRGYPYPRILVMRPEQVKDKINTIRVAISSEAREHHRGRMFEVLFVPTIHSLWPFGDSREEVALVGIYYGSGGMKEKINLAMDKIMQKGIDL